MCSSLDHTYFNKVSDNIFLPKWLQRHQDYIGATSTSTSTSTSKNPDVVEEWIEIISDHNQPNFIGKSRVWNPSKKECKGIITQSSYRFFWTYSGSMRNPQAKILRYS